MTSKKRFHVIFGAVFFQWKHVGRHFFKSKQVGCHFRPYFLGGCPDFHGFSPDQNFWGFSATYTTGCSYIFCIENCFAV